MLKRNYIKQGSFGATNKKIVPIGTFDLDGFVETKIQEVINQEPPAIGNSNFKLNCKIWWQVELNSSVGLMDNYYQQISILPSTSPYAYISVNDTSTIADFSKAATSGPKSIVDYILVQILNDNKQVVQTRNCFVTSSGYLVGMDCVSLPQFDLPKGSYYIAFKHRNMLRFRTKEKISVNTSIINLNFADGITEPYNNGLVKYGGYFCMVGGDANGDGVINGADETLQAAQSGLFDDYSNTGDYGMNGSVDAFDTIIWEVNQNRTEQI